jgi:fermentation-respiration switch protein FrsA (DUF1100 family)
VLFVIRVLVVTVVLYGLMVGAYAFYEPRKVFPAPKLDRLTLRRAAVDFSSAHSVAVQELSLTTSDGVALYGWRVGEAEKLILYFSGNGTAVSIPVEIYAHFVARGVAFVHISYRGYPGSGGRPNERGLLRDALAGWEEARRTHAPEDIIVHGRSLGGGVATALLEDLKKRGEPMPAGLIMEATFTSAVDVAKHSHPWLPVDFLMRNRFLSLERARGLSLPALVFHGSGDATIPYSHAESLAEALDAELQPARDDLVHKDWLLQDADVDRVHAAFLKRVFGGDT